MAREREEFLTAMEAIEPLSLLELASLIERRLTQISDLLCPDIEYLSAHDIRVQNALTGAETEIENTFKGLRNQLIELGVTPPNEKPTDQP